MTDLVYGLLLDGNLPLEERHEAFNAIVHFTRDASGLAKMARFNGLQRLAVGTSLNQLRRVEYEFGPTYREALLKEKIQALEELRKHNPGVWEAGIKGFFHSS